MVWTDSRGYRCEPGPEPLRRLRSFEEGVEFLCQPRGVGEGPVLGALFEEEVEGIDDGHLGDEVHRHRELPGRFGHHHAGEEVALRVLLPVQEVFLGLDAERIAQHRGPAVRRGPQPDRLGSEVDGPVVAVPGLVMERDLERH